jgi:hypothetical protein
MGLHAGEAAGAGGDYHGPTVNRAARIMAAGHGGQVLLSSAAASLVRDRLPPDVSLADLGEQRLKDLSVPERVFQLVHPQLRREFPPLATLTPRLAALPEDPSLFVGRTAELAAIGERLADPTARLLTLVGAGGIGKTRLALRAARRPRRGSAEAPSSSTCRRPVTRAASSAPLAARSASPTAPGSSSSGS